MEELSNRLVWTGVFAKVRIPDGSFKRNLGHTIWVHIYTKSEQFYQVGFEEGSESGPEGRPNATTWSGFYASTQDSIPPGTDNVVTHGAFTKGVLAGKEIVGEKGKEYSLYIEMNASFVTLSIWDEDDVILGTIDLPDDSKVLRGGCGGPHASLTLEALRTYAEDDWNDIEDFIIRNLMLQGDEETGTDFQTKYLRVEININMPPDFLGVKRLDDSRIAIGKGYPLPSGANAEI